MTFARENLKEFTGSLVSIRSGSPAPVFLSVLLNLWKLWGTVGASRKNMRHAFLQAKLQHLSADSPKEKLWGESRSWIYQDFFLRVRD